MNQMRIYNYEILNFDQQPTIYSNTGFSKITDPRMVSVLQRLEEKQEETINKAELEQIIKNEQLDPTATVAFLKSLTIIGEPAVSPYFKKTSVFTDWEVSTELKCSLTKRLGGKIQFHTTLPVETIPTDQPTLFIFVYLKLKPKELRTIYTNLAQRNPHCGFSVGFISGRHFHLTAAYIPDVGNPCAFCTLDRIAHYETLRSSQHYWSKIWTFCLTRKIDLPTTKIDEFQNALILGTITSFSHQLTYHQRARRTQDQVLLSRTLDLTSGETTEDCNVHWPFCECLGLKP
ncbi:McbB family protein [Pseudomonas oryzicola]|uniref:McbB family protein n=1 Tax=Pseudomonas oryzicola TaxID=485876 RepID=A0ABS6QAE9_9PSED|nr:McbB family protein [Pseudomonas oryzicola]MBV4491081.1 McbB family protein [Pseudomonas oryzicola]